jgi:hypothetical protein
MIKTLLIKGDLIDRAYLGLFSNPDVYVIWSLGSKFSQNSVYIGEKSKNPMYVNVKNRPKCFLAKDLTCLLGNEEIIFYVFLSLKPIIYIDPKTLPDYIVGSKELIQSLVNDISEELIKGFSGSVEDYEELFDFTNFEVIKLKEFPSKTIEKVAYYKYDRYGINYDLVYEGVSYDNDYWKANDYYYKINYRGNYYLIHYHRTESSQNWIKAYSYETKEPCTELESLDLYEILEYYLWKQKR